MNPHNFMPALGWALVHFAWQGALLAATYKLLEFILRTAQAKYIWGCVVLSLMLGAPIWTFQHNLLKTETVPPKRSARFAPGEPQIAPATAEIADSGSSRESAESFRKALERCFPWLVGFWLLGVTILFIRLGAEYWRLRAVSRSGLESPGREWENLCDRLRTRMGIIGPVRIARSILVEVPSVIGWLKPVVLMPASMLAGLTPEEIESVLLHELAHILRHDYLANMLQTIAETFLFYHPGVWLVSKAIRREREHCCDDIAVQAGEGPIELARALAKLELFRSGPALSLSVSGSGLAARIRRLLQPQSRRAPGPVMLVLTLIILSFVAGISSSSMKAQEKAPTTFKNSGKVDAPAIDIETRFYEIPTDFELPNGIFIQGATRGILTASQAKELLTTLKNLTGAKLIAAPHVITPSGRSAIVSTFPETNRVDVKLAEESRKNPASVANSSSVQVEITPELRSNGYEVRFNANVTDSGKLADRPGTSSNAIGYITTKVLGSVYDGQTYVMSGKNWTKSRVTLITVRLLDSYGNPFHKIKPFDVTTVPPQSE